MDKKKYNREEVIAASTVYFDGQTQPATIWTDRYALRDGAGRWYEATPADMHLRMATELGRIEAQYADALSVDSILELLQGFRYIVPAGNVMAGVGNGGQLSVLSNCFVAGTHEGSDTFGGILQTDEELVQLLKRRGGVGIDLSGLRPKGSVLSNAALASPGFLPTAKRYSASVGEVEQRSRKGALMLTMSVQHPDAADFITAKTVAGVAENANFSLRVDDAFMQAVADGRTYRQRFPTAVGEAVYRADTSAGELWAKLVRAAWQCGDPGLLFWDTIRRESLSQCYAAHGFAPVTTNPCGEVALSAYESCRLLSLNLFSYVRQPFTAEAEFDSPLFARHAALALRLADDIVDLELERLDKIIEKINADALPEALKCRELQLWQRVREKTTAGRRVGVGVLGLADMLAALGLAYGSAEAAAVTEQTMRTLALTVYGASVDLAQTRGAFSLYDAKAEETNAFVQRLRGADSALYTRMKAHGRRNMACLSIAPTGTISLLAQTSSGIEPVFKTSYARRIKTERAISNGEGYETVIIQHPRWAQWLTMQGISLTDETAVAEALPRSPYAGSTALEVSPLARVTLLSVIQRWIDSGVSVTINLPSSTDEATVSRIYKEAWEQGCKGITVYRDGSRENILEATVATPAADSWANSAVVLERRPDVLECDVVRFQNNKEKWVAFVGLLDGRPYEIFTGLQDDDEGIVLPKSVTRGRIIRHVDEDGKRYDFQFENKRGYKTTVEGLSEKFNKEYWNYAKLISGVLRYRMPVESVIKLVSSLQLGNDNINTWKVGVERALKKYVNDGSELDETLCPGCGKELTATTDGQLMCTHCNHTK